MSEGTYKKVSARIEADWYPYHENEWFTHTDICYFFQWDDPEIKKAVSYKLYHDMALISEPKLEKNNKAFRLVDRTIEEIDWQTADPDKIYRIKFPYDAYTNNGFPFEDWINIPPGGLILVGGVSNAGKTTLLLNLMVRNMDVFDCHYFTSELSAVALKRRLNPFEDIYELRNGDGKPKFHIWDRFENFQDVIKPGGFNLVDYLDVNKEAEYFKLKPYARRIKRALGGKGIAAIALQKPPGRADAYGGANLRGDADLYLAMDFGVLTVIKAKDWVTENPNGRKFAFDIEHNGSMFTNIREVIE